MLAHRVMSSKRMASRDQRLAARTKDHSSSRVPEVVCGGFGGGTNQVLLRAPPVYKTGTSLQPHACDAGTSSTVADDDLLPILSPLCKHHIKSPPFPSRGRFGLQPIHLAFRTIPGKIAMASLNSLIRAGASTGAITSRYHCPVCDRRYGKEKTLNRHYRAIHLKHLFTCRDCPRPKTFSRRDYLVRHQAEVHNRSSNTVRCAVCDIELLGRTLDDHFESKAHQDAQREVDDLACAAFQTFRQPTIVTVPHAENTIDPLLLTTWLLYKINISDCRQDTWDHQEGHFRPSADVLDLKGLAIRILSRKIRGYEQYEAPQLIRSIETIAVAEAMINGWRNVLPHKRALQHLRKQRNLVSHRTAEDHNFQTLNINTILGGLPGVLALEKPKIQCPDSRPWYYQNLKIDRQFHWGPEYFHAPAEFTMLIRDDVGISPQRPSQGPTMLLKRNPQRLDLFEPEANCKVSRMRNQNERTLRLGHMPGEIRKYPFVLDFLNPWL